MTPETASYSDPPPAQMGTFARITGVFFEPGKTFADIGQRPTWFVPVLLAALAAAVFMLMVGQRIGFERVVRQQMATNARMAQAMEQVPADQREARIAAQGRMFA